MINQPLQFQVVLNFGEYYDFSQSSVSGGWIYTYFKITVEESIV